ncbi:hypothetical protein ACFUOZ_07750 [Paenarthrobacter sp. NPDC057355]|uniref:hypothetical protein n=1 Tax=Paenarthrobacter sp. NPDC057355 TaxID=3346105 RepID=UPI00363CE162
MENRPMPVSRTLHDEFVREGLKRLQLEAFSERGPGSGAEEVVSTSVVQQAMSRRYDDVKRNGQWEQADISSDFSDEAMDRWLLELRERCYVIGEGTWMTCRVFLYPDQPGRLEVFDEELLTKGLHSTSGRLNAPSSAATLTSELLAFPRTAENIPSWIQDAFASEGVTPPLYNPEFNSVDWNNRRRPVTERGTDFTVEPTIIDPSLKPGVFAKIGKRLFGG